MQMKDRPTRSPLERALMLAPELLRGVLAPVFRLPPGSRLRTAVVKSVLDRSYAALARGDIELTEKLFFHPDSILNFGDDVGVDYAPRYEGRAESFAIYRQWLAEWEEMHREPVGFVDRGETLVVLARERVRGSSSGLEIERELGQVFRLRGPGIAEHSEYRSWDAALSA